EKLRKSEEKYWNEWWIQRMCRVKHSERNEALTTTAHIQKNGRMSCVCDPARLPRFKAVADARYAGRATFSVVRVLQCRAASARTSPIGTRIRQNAGNPHKPPDPGGVNPGRTRKN